MIIVKEGKRSKRSIKTSRIRLHREGLYYICKDSEDIRMVREHGTRVDGWLYEKIPAITRREQVLLNKLRVV